MLWALLVILATFVVVDVLIQIAGIFAILPILERSPPFAVEPSSPAPAAERVAFKTRDGLTLNGSLHLPGDVPPVGTVIFCPELGGDHWSAAWYCRALPEAGFAVLAFDFRNQGQSDQMPGYAPIHWLTEFEVTDALAAIDYVKERRELSGLPLGLFGISRGGSAALVAAARCPEIQCVACEGVFSISSMSLHYTLRWASLYHPAWIMRLYPMWHIRATLAVARWVSQIRRHCRYVVLESWLRKLAGRPVLMIVDGRDTYVLPDINEALFQSFPQSSTHRWTVRGAKHNMARELDPEEFDRRIVELFTQMVDTPRQAASGPKSRPDASVRPYNNRLSS